MAEDPTLPVLRWAKRLPFLPGSTQQVQDYLRHKGYKIPIVRDPETGKFKPSTGEKGLAKLAATHPGDPVLPLVLDCRHITKGIGYLYDTYLHADGRMRPRYTFIPKTGRLSSKAPNLMNLPQGRKGDVMKEVADAIRGTVIPCPGYVLGEIDWNAVEALLLGFFAEDETYMRLAKLGVHSFVCCHVVKEPVDMSMGDEDLKGFFNEIAAKYPHERALCKKMIYAGSYGQGIKNLAGDMGVPVAQARLYRAIYEECCPKVAKWKTSIAIRAHKEGQLINPFGHCMRFFSALTKSKTTGKWKAGDEYTDVLAFLPQSTCAAMLREVLLTLGHHPDEGTKFRLLIPTHDSISFEAREDCVDEVFSLITREMERPWAELNQLRVETEAVLGPSLKKSEMRPWSPGTGPSPS